MPVSTRLPQAAPPKILLLLGAAVLLVHLLILQVTPQALVVSSPASGQPFITRTVVLTPSPPLVARPAPTPRPRKALMPAPVAAAPTTPAAQAPPQPIADSASPPTTSPVEASAVESPASPAQPAEAPRTATYAVPGSRKLLYNIEGEVRSLPYHARAELLWLHDGSSYQARLEVGAFLLGSRVQTSRGLLTPEGLAPIRFGDKVRSEVAAHFERDKGKVIFSANTPEVPLQAGAQDHLSIFMQLASLLAGEPERYPAGSAIEMQAVGAREADIWRFTVDGAETLQLPGGEQATLKLTRPPRQAYDLKLELWLAPALGYLPARIRLTQNNGDFIDQQWRSSESP